MNWWRHLRKRDQLETDLDAELRYHFERQVTDYLRQGLSEAEARRQARLEFGGLDQIKEHCRDARGTRWVHDLAQDVRFAARLLAKDRWFTLAAVFALALGIGATNTVFTMIYAMNFRGLPVEHPERIIHLGTRDVRDRDGGVSYLDYQDWRDHTRAFEGMAAWSTTAMTVSREALPPDWLSGTYLSANAFTLLGEKPIVGRDFVAEDDRLGAPAVVILGHLVWMNRYGGDPAVLGRTITINGVPTIVIGVMEEGFRFPVFTDLWQPLASMPGLMDQRRDARTLAAFGRLAERVGLAEARAELDAIAARLGREYPDTNADVRPTAVRFGDHIMGSATDLIPLTLIGAVGFVLLVACANVANLLLARSTRRSREVSIRASLGATRWRIVRQLLVECVLLAFVAGLLGLALSVAGVRFFSAAVEREMPYWVRFTMDQRVFAFLAAACLGTSLHR